jgi:hypothetical protein
MLTVPPVMTVRTPSGSSVCRAALYSNNGRGSSSSSTVQGALHALASLVGWQVAITGDATLFQLPLLTQ